MRRITGLLFFEMQIYCAHLKREGLSAKEIAMKTGQPVDKIFKYLQRYRSREQPAEFYDVLAQFDLDKFLERWKRFKKRSIKRKKRNEYD